MNYKIVNDNVSKDLNSSFRKINVEEKKDNDKILKDFNSLCNTERSNRTNENKIEKINNIFYEISDDNVSKDDTSDINLSKDVIYDNSNDNYLSNDDMSVDTNNDKKNKKKKKKIIKKKKKVKRW